MLDILKETKVKTLMNKKVMTIHQDDELSEAHDKFVHGHATHLMVIDNDKKLIGLLSQKYLYKTRSPRKVLSDEMKFRPDFLRDGADTFYTKEMLDGFILSKVMQKNPFSLGPDASLSEAILNMANKNLSCIPIVDENKKILGVLTHRELIEFLGKQC